MEDAPGADRRIHGKWMDSGISLNGDSNFSLRGTDVPENGEHP